MPVEALIGTFLSGGLGLLCWDVLLAVDYGACNVREDAAAGLRHGNGGDYSVVLLLMGMCLVALLCGYAFEAIMFPTIFALSLERVGQPYQARFLF